MDPNKPTRKSFLQVAQLSIIRESLFPADHMDQPSFTVKIPDPSIWDLADPVRTFERKQLTAPGLHFSSHPIQQICQTFSVCRLDHIVRCVHPVTAQDKLLMPGHKDKKDIPVKRTDPLCSPDPVHRLHLHIEKKQFHLPRMSLKPVYSAHPI